MQHHNKRQVTSCTRNWEGPVIHDLLLRKQTKRIAPYTEFDSNASKPFISQWKPQVNSSFKTNNLLSHTVFRGLSPDCFGPVASQMLIQGIPEHGGEGWRKKGAACVEINLGKAK